MRIQGIEITNYKAFLGTHKINVDGKNLFIYGENGSDKSSLYYALKDFFQSSLEDIDWIPSSHNCTLTVIILLSRARKYV